MSVVHFDPYFNSDCHDAPEKSSCGTIGFWDGDSDEDCYQSTNVWDKVTCKKCLKQKERLQKGFESDEKEIVKQMGEMADFMSKEHPTND